jgi:hypothetical protein
MSAQPFFRRRNPEELRPGLLTAKPRNPFQGCEQSLLAFSNPGFQSKHFHPTRAARVGTPARADISQRFQRLLILARTDAFSTFCAKPTSWTRTYEPK